MTAQSMWEISPSQAPGRGIFRESPVTRFLCDISRMANGVNIAVIRETIEREMKAKGFSRRSLSTAAGLSQSAVRDVLDRTENPGISTLHKIAEALELPIDALSGNPLTVPVLGKVGAGGAVLFSIDPDLESDEDLEMVPRPPLASGRLMALVVSGESMLPKYEDGDVLYVRRDHEGVLPSYVGQYCAVRTVEGGTFIKLLAPGTIAGRYTLRSLNAADMENVELVWASPVQFIMPRQSRPES
jgi:phage repressor protein C with HTH and peptisase S24 domain